MADSTPPAGESAPVEEKPVAKTAEDYMIPLSPTDQGQWKGKEKDFAEFAREQAKGLFPTFAPAIDQGILPKALLGPYTAMAKNMLGPGVQPDWNDPKWRAAIDGARTDKGLPAPMTLSQWRDHIINTKEFGYEYTPQAHAVARQLVSDLHEAMGGDRG